MSSAGKRIPTTHMCADTTANQNAKKKKHASKGPTWRRERREENVVQGREARWEAGEYKDAIAPWGVGEQWTIRHLKRP